MSEEKRLFLLDGHALVYRAHYAFITRPLYNSKGMNTSAVNGFVRALWDILKNQNPTHIAVAFDPKGPTFRNDIFPEYKANRDAQPEDITIAFPYIENIVKAFNIPIITIPGYEADDAIGTLAKQAEKEGFKVFMVTPDKDYAQLVSENIFMYKPSRQGGGVDIIGIPEVLEKWGIKDVSQVIDMLGLQGDSVDNIPGVPGIGPKTASKLLNTYGSIETLLDSVEDLKGKQKENLINFRDQAILSKVLATISLDVPTQFDASKYVIEPYNKEALKEIFKDLEFRTLAISVLGDDFTPGGTQGNLFGSTPTKTFAEKKESTDYNVVEKSIENVEHDYKLVQSDEDIDALVAILEKTDEFAFDTETTSLNEQEAELVGLAFSIKEKTAYYIPTPVDREETLRIASKFQGVLKDPTKLKIGQNLKYDINVLHNYNIDVEGPYFDTMIAHYLIEPDLRHKLDYLSESYLEYKMVPIDALIGKRGPKQLSMRDIDVEKVAEYAGEDADITFQIKQILVEKLEEEGLLELFNTLEMPLIDVLSDMETAGVRINGQFLNDYSKKLGELILEKEAEIYRKAGVHFNIASPKQVGEVLFDRLKIPYRWSKTKSGQYSTNEEKLRELAPKNDIVQSILNFRKY